MAEKSTTTMPVLDLSVLRKQRIQIDLGDDKEHILEINTTDMNVVTRLSDGYNNLVELDKKVNEIGTATDDIEETDTNEQIKSKLESFANRLRDIDSRMREIIDYIFDTNASEVCCPNGSMYDPIAGKLRYEHIVDALMTLYTDTLTTEMQKTKDRIKSHTAKYTKKRKSH